MNRDSPKNTRNSSEPKTLRIVPRTRNAGEVVRMPSLDLPERYVAIDVETTALEPEAGMITAIGLGVPGGTIEVEVNDPSETSEVDLLRWLGQKLEMSEADAIVAWNAPFDMRFIRSRCLILGERNPTNGMHMFDEKAWFKSYARFRRSSLNYVAKELGIGSKVGKGHEMPSLYWKGEYEAIARHCARDIELLIRIHERGLEVQKGKKRIPVIENPYLEEEEEEIPSFG